MNIMLFEIKIIILEPKVFIHVQMWEFTFIIELNIGNTCMIVYF